MSTVPMEGGGEALVSIDITPEMMQELVDKAKAEQQRLEMRLDELAREIEVDFRKRKSNRQAKEAEWLIAEELYLGSLAHTNGSALMTGETPFRPDNVSRRSPEYNAVRVKCDATISTLWSMQFAAGDKNWDITPTTADPMEAAAADKMEAVIERQLNKCRYPMHARDSMRDRVVLGVGILKGPLNADEPYVQYKPENASDGSLVAVPDVQTRKQPVVKRVNPWFFFPDDSATTIEKARDTIELHPMNVEEVRKLALKDGFDRDAIERAIQRGANQENATNYYQFATLTGNTEAFKGMLTILERHGPITIDQMGDLGIKPSYESPTGTIYAEMWVLNGVIIKAVEENIEGCFRAPYAVCEWQRDPSSIYGIGLAIQLADQQRVLNVTYRMILDNSAISSGPQVILDKLKITPANGKWELKPDKIWYANDPDGNVAQAIHFFIPDNVTQQLMGVFALARDLANDEAAIPYIQPGTQSAQTGDTAYGTKMVMNSGTTVVEYLNELWDDRVTEPLIRGEYAWNMQYNEDPSIKGAFDVDVKTSSEYRARQVYISELEKLSVEASQNPELGMFIDKGELTKARLSMMSLPFKNIIKSPEKIAQDQEAAANQPPPPEVQIQQQELELKQRQLALEEQRLQFEQTLKHQEMMMEQENRQQANYARLRESESQVLTASLNRDIEMAKLAQKDEVDRGKIMADLQKTSVTEDTKKFLAGMEYTHKQRELDQTDEELKIKRKTGTGI